jgi:hypothetical protein
VKLKPTLGSPFFRRCPLTASLRRRRMSMYISIDSNNSCTLYTNELQLLFAGVTCNARFEVPAAVFKSSGMWRYFVGYFLTFLLWGISVQIRFS